MKVSFILQASNPVHTFRLPSDNRLPIPNSVYYNGRELHVKLIRNRLEMANSSTIDLKRLGENIRLARTGKGWNLADLARESGISKSYISDLENGVAGKPNIQYVFTIARALGTTLDVLLDGAVPSDSIADRGAPSHTDLPPGLAELKADMTLSDEDVERLATIHFRGNRPRDKEGWRYLLKTLNMLGRGTSE